MRTRTLSVDGISVYCLEFAKSTGEPNAVARCAIEGSTLFPWYEGDKKYLPDFYAMLRGMSLEARPSVRSE